MNFNFSREIPWKSSVLARAQFEFAPQFPWIQTLTHHIGVSDVGILSNACLVPPLELGHVHYARPYSFLDVGLDFQASLESPLCCKISKISCGAKKH